MSSTIKSKKKKKKSGWPTNAELIQRINASRRETQEHMEQNGPIMVSKHVDGKWDRRPVPGLELLTQRNPEPMSAEELKGIRAKFKISQELLARWLMVSVGTVRNWEQGNGVPQGPALRLLDRYRPRPQGD